MSEMTAYGMGNKCCGRVYLLPGKDDAQALVIYHLCKS